MNSLAFFTFGGPKLGMGHHYRCSLIAESLKEIAEIKFFYLADEISEKFLSERVGTFAELNALNEEDFFRPWQNNFNPGVNVIFFDTLKSGREKIQYFKKLSRVITLDDSSDGALFADASLNLLYHLSQEEKSQAKGRVIEDLSFMPLRKEFAGKKSAETSNRLIILQGGADGHNGINRILSILRNFETDLIITPVTGPSYLFHDELRQNLEKLHARSEHFSNVTDISRIMQESKIGISGGGVSLYELMAMGVPVLSTTGEEKEMETLIRMNEMGLSPYLGSLSTLESQAVISSIENLLLPMNWNKQRAEYLNIGLGEGVTKIRNLIEDLWAN